MGELLGVSAFLVGAAAFKAVERLFMQSLVGSIPIHSRVRWQWRRAMKRRPRPLVRSPASPLSILTLWRAVSPHGLLEDHSELQQLGILQHLMLPYPA